MKKSTAGLIAFNVPNVYKPLEGRGKRAPNEGQSTLRCKEQWLIIQLIGTKYGTTNVKQQFRIQ